MGARDEAPPTEADDVFVSETLIFDAPSIYDSVSHLITILMMRMFPFNVAQRVFKDIQTSCTNTH